MLQSKISCVLFAGPISPHVMVAARQNDQLLAPAHGLFPLGETHISGVEEIPTINMDSPRNDNCLLSRTDASVIIDYSEHADAFLACSPFPKDGKRWAYLGLLLR